MIIENARVTLRFAYIRLEGRMHDDLDFFVIIDQVLASIS